MGIEMVLDMAAACYDDRTATGTARDGLSYADLDRVAAGGAELVRSAGAGSVAFLGLNGPVLPALMFAAARAGVPVCPLNYRLTAAQLSELLGQLDDPYLVVGGEHVGLVPGHQHLVADDWLAAAAVQPAEPHDGPEDDAPAVLLFTSGTTAAPRRRCCATATSRPTSSARSSSPRADEDDAALVSVPPYHIAGVGATCCRTSTPAAASSTSRPSPPEAWLDDGARRAASPTRWSCRPCWPGSSTTSARPSRADAPTLRSLAYGGARMPRRCSKRALRAFPDDRLRQRLRPHRDQLAPSPCSAPTTTAPRSARTTRGRARRLGSVGRLVPGIEVEIRDDDGMPVVAGEPGEIWVRGQQVSGEYRGADPLDADGWFPTRDRGWLDDDGYLFIEGRADDTIIRGGENIAPAEIEDVLLRHPGVRDVAVVGVPDEEWGQRIAAVVVRRGASGSIATRCGVRPRARCAVRRPRTLIVLPRRAPPHPDRQAAAPRADRRARRS